VDARPVTAGKDKNMTELQADRDSDRRIAERLGLSVKYRGTMQHPIPFIDEGNAFGPELPRYTTDLNAAVVLYDPRLGMSIMISHVRFPTLEWTCIIGFEGKDFYGTGTSPALAVCRAWWAWMDGREE